MCHYNKKGIILTCCRRPKRERIILDTSEVQIMCCAWNQPGLNSWALIPLGIAMPWGSENSQNDFSKHPTVSHNLKYLSSKIFSKLFSLVVMAMEKTIDFMRCLGFFETSSETVQLSALPKTTPLCAIFLIYLTGRRLLWL